MSPTTRVLRLLRDYESRNVTFIEPDGSWPIVWDRAQGVHVWDAQGKRYLDLTGAFGVAAAGHANPRVVKSGQAQMARLLHAMGDVHPHELKARLARELSRTTFERWLQNNAAMEGRRTVSRPAGAKTIFCNSGFEAVEAALKTALLATGKPGIIAFAGAYHGLGYGALNATHREHFRGPFHSQLREFGAFVPFPSVPPPADTPRGSRRPSAVLADVLRKMEETFRRRQIGAVLVEPIQVRGGVNIPPPEFLPSLRRLCDRRGALLVLDEIYTGFGRTGKWFACEHTGVVPDIVCLGKALTGGFPLSACVGRADLMDAAWPPSNGEAIHTSTFLGHPVGCAMALAQMAELRRLKLAERSRRLGEILVALLQSQVFHRKFQINSRGQGLLTGIELCRPDGVPATTEVLTLIKAMLGRGYIVLPEGEHANVVSFTPPLTISERQLRQTVRVLAAEVRKLS